MNNPSQRTGHFEGQKFQNPDQNTDLSVSQTATLEPQAFPSLQLLPSNTQAIQAIHNPFHQSSLSSWFEIASLNIKHQRRGLQSHFPHRLISSPVPSCPVVPCIASRSGGPVGCAAQSPSQQFDGYTLPLHATRHDALLRNRFVQLSSIPTCVSAYSIASLADAFFYNVAITS